MTTWHLDRDLAERYTGGRVNDVLANSVEQHLLACAACRGLVADTSAIDTARLDAVWAEVLETVEAPRVGLVERGLRALGVSDSTAKLVAATPSLRGAWLTGVLGLLVLAFLAAHASRHGMVVFVALAPVLPVLGVALAFGPQSDPTLEVAAASPYSLVRLLAARTTFVVGSTVLPALGLALLTPDRGIWALGWLLPSMAMCSVVLATASRIEPHVSSLSLSAAWVTLTVWTAARDTALLAEHATVVQLLSLAVLAAAGWSLTTRQLEPATHRSHTHWRSS
jgi:hypothetical protein